MRLLPMMIGLGGGGGRGEMMMRATENGIPLEPEWMAMVNLATDEGRMNMKFPPAALPDAELRGVSAPTLLLIGDHEVLYRPEDMLALARRRNARPGRRGRAERQSHRGDVERGLCESAAGPVPARMTGPDQAAASAVATGVTGGWLGMRFQASRPAIL